MGGTDLQWTALQTWQAQTEMETGTACRQSLRALQALREARARGMPCQKEERALENALRSTVFGQAFEPALVRKLVPMAEYSSLPAGSQVELAGDTDGLYVLIAGAGSFVRGPLTAPRPMRLTITSASDLPGDSERDRLDPYVVVSFGTQQFQTHVAEDAGPDPVFNWSTVVQYSGEAAIEFTVYEHDKFSRDDLLGSATLPRSDFDRGFEGKLLLYPPEGNQPGAKRAGVKDTEVFVRDPEQEGQAGFLEISVSIGEEPPSPEQVKEQEGAKKEQQFRRVRTGDDNISGEAAEPSPQPGARSSRRAGAERGSQITTGSALKRAMHTQKMLKLLGVAPAAKPEPPPEPKTKPWRIPGYQYCPGSFFGYEEGGGLVRLHEKSVLLFVPRLQLREVMQEIRLEQRHEQHAFLRRWLPGAQSLDKRVFETFSAAFQAAVFPRGHVLCTAGSPAANEARRVYIIKQGTCRVLLPTPSVSDSSGNAPSSPTRDSSAGVLASPIRNLKESARARSNCQPIGLLGEGSLLGYASALFGLPEPFTVVPDETVTVLWISTADRPVANWPREVVNKLNETLRVQIDWHGRRTQSVSTAATASGDLFTDVEKSPPAWNVTDSKFLRRKELAAWQKETIEDRVTSSTWWSHCAQTQSPSPSPSQSCPVLPSLGALPSPTSTRSLLSSSPSNIVASSRSLQGSLPSAHRDPPAGLAMRETPWGTWRPSGLLPDPAPPAYRITMRARAKARRKADREKAFTERLMEGKVTVKESSPRPDVAPRHNLNLTCGSDFRTLEAIASPVAVGKMYRQQMLKKQSRAAMVATSTSPLAITAPPGWE